METATDERAAILATIAGFVAQRSGIDARDYFETWSDSDGVAAWKSDKRDNAREGRDARAMLAVIEGRDISADDLKAALEGAFSGRLSWDGKTLEYTPGQNSATEYRAAACAVLALALRRYWRADGNDVRKTATGIFGRGLAARWFN